GGGATRGAASAPGNPPPAAGLAALAAARLAWRPVQTFRVTNELIRVMPTLAPALSGFIGQLLGLNRGDGGIISSTPGRAPATPFNRPVTQDRRGASPPRRPAAVPG